MKVELHCHTSRYSGCSQNTPEEMMTRLVARGYDAVYLTEHSAIWDASELARLQQSFPDIRIYSGVEITDPVIFQDVLVLGTNDPTYIDLAAAGHWADVLSRARDEGRLTVLAHPCRFDDSHTILSHGLKPDALEYGTGNHDDAMAATARLLADHHGLHLVNAGDLHTVNMVDEYWIETDRPVDEADDIRSIILDGAYRNISNV